MSSLSRKDFLRLSAWGMVASLLPVHEINALSFILDPKTSNSKKESLTDALLIAKQAKENFFRKNYELAEQLYLECIALMPSHIQFYDGLENVYGAQTKSLQSVILFKNALIANSRRVEFYDRAAKSLVRLELGNKKVAKEYNQNFRPNLLLEDALALYSEAIVIDPTKIYLTKGYDFVRAKIEINATSINYKTNLEYKTVKKENARIVKRQLKESSPATLNLFLERFENKKRNTLYLPKEIENRNKNIHIHKKKFLNFLAEHYIKNEDSTMTLEVYNRIFELDPKDSNNIHNLKKILYKQNRFSEFIPYQKIFAYQRDQLTAYIGVLEAVEVAYLNNNYSSDDFELANSIAQEVLTNYPMSEFNLINLVVKYNKILVIQSNLDLALLITENTLKSINLFSPYYIVKLMQSYAKVLFEKGSFDMSQEVLLMGINGSDQPPAEEVLASIHALLIQANGMKFNHKLPLYYQLFINYSSQNNHDQAAAILGILQNHNPNDPFVTKRT